MIYNVFFEFIAIHNGSSIYYFNRLRKNKVAITYENFIHKLTDNIEAIARNNRSEFIDFIDIKKKLTLGVIIIL
jgi:hypothetical protein